MKRLFIGLLVCLFVASASVVSAQAIMPTEQHKKVESYEVPAPVLQSVADKFEKVYKSKKQQWVVNYLESQKVITPQSYELTVKDKSVDFKGVFYPAGDVKSVNMVVKDPALPSSVQTALNEHYSDWKVVQKEELKENDWRNSRDEYKVKIENGSDRRLVVVNSNGEIIKDKRTK